MLVMCRGVGVAMLLLLASFSYYYLNHVEGYVRVYGPARNGRSTLLLVSVCVGLTLAWR